jgi:serine/threonine-protein kinase RsbW
MPSRRNAIPPTIERILRAAAAAGFGQAQRDSFAVALSEALANAVVHGNTSRPTANVDVRVEVDPLRSATVTVRDSGPGFDRDTLPDPSDPEHLLIPRGRGVFLMRRLLDRVDYNRKGNQVRLTLLRRTGRRGP